MRVSRQGQTPNLRATCPLHSNRVQRQNRMIGLLVWAADLVDGIIVVQ